MTSGGNNFIFFPEKQLAKLEQFNNKGKLGPKWLLSEKAVAILVTDRCDKNNEHRLSWRSILYGLLLQHPQCGSIAAPAVWGLPPMAMQIR